MGAYSNTDETAEPGSNTVPMYTAAILIGALVFIVAVRRGFDGFVPTI